MRRVGIAGLWLGVAAMAPAAGTEKVGYRSPYRVEFATPPSGLMGDLGEAGRGDRSAEALVPGRDWYSDRTRERWGAWGPPAARYPVPAGFSGWGVERKRERVVAAALRFEGYAYQHHHVPDWSPPEGWPWSPTCAGANGKGVDCSNLTGFAYNLGCGLRIDTNVVRQAELRSARLADGREVQLDRVQLPADYRERVEALRTGDLVFIRGRRDGPITHVVIWVGPIGKGPDGTPLVLDSHGADTRDAAGRAIPCGVRLRPFRERSWFNACASHALRAFPDDPALIPPSR